MTEVHLPSRVGQALLTIAIPTFNRSFYLSDLLESLLPQLDGESRIELIVSDNCSDDNTSSVLSSFRARGLNFTHLTNSVNLGPDANFLQCFDNATGHYFWLLGDDDVVIPDAIIQIITLLEQGTSGRLEQHVSFDIVFISTFGFIGEEGRLRSKYPKDRLSRFAEVMTDGEYFLARVNALISLISAVIVNKNSLVDRHLPIERFNNSYLAQLAWIFPLLKKTSRILYIWEPLVGYRSYNSGGWAPCKVFGVNLQQIAVKQFAAEPALAKILMNGVLRYWFPGVIMQIRQGDHPHLVFEECTDLLRTHFSGNWRYWIFVHPILIFPVRVANIFAAFVKLFNGGSRFGEGLFRHFFGGLRYRHRFDVELSRKNP